MKDKTLNLKASQAIASLGIECESETSYFQEKKERTYSNWTYQKDVPWSLLGTTEKELSTNENLYHIVIPAPNLQELITLLPMIGEKLKESILLEITFNGIHGENPLNDLVHNLLDTYLTNYDMRDVSAEIIKIIKE